MSNGLLKVYSIFPWGMKTKDALEYGLIDDLPQFFYGIDGETEYDNYNMMYERTHYINPSFIYSARNNFMYDDMSTQYNYCEITMRDGEIYYLPYWWQDVEEGKDE